MNTQDDLDAGAFAQVSPIRVAVPPIVLLSPSSFGISSTEPIRLLSCEDNPAQELGALATDLYALLSRQITFDLFLDFNANMQIVCSALRLAGRHIAQGRANDVPMLLDYAAGAAQRAGKLAHSLLENY